MNGSKKLRKFEGTCYIPGEQLAMMAKYYRGANLNLNLSLIEDDHSLLQQSLDNSCWCSKLDDVDRMKFQRMRGGELKNHCDHFDYASGSVSRGELVFPGSGSREKFGEGISPCGISLAKRNRRKRDILEDDYDLRNNFSVYPALHSIHRGYDCKSQERDRDKCEIRCAVCTEGVCAVCKNPVSGRNCRCKCPIPNAGMCITCNPEPGDCTPGAEVKTPTDLMTNLLYLMMGSQLAKSIQRAESCCPCDNSSTCKQSDVDSTMSRSSTRSYKSCNKKVRKIYILHNDRNKRSKRQKYCLNNSEKHCSDSSIESSEEDEGSCRCRKCVSMKSGCVKLASFQQSFDNQRKLRFCDSNKKEGGAHALVRCCDDCKCLSKSEKLEKRIEELEKNALNSPEQYNYSKQINGNVVQNEKLSQDPKHEVSKEVKEQHKVIKEGENEKASHNKEILYVRTQAKDYDIDENGSSINFKHLVAGLPKMKSDLEQLMVKMNHINLNLLQSEQHSSHGYHKGKVNDTPLNLPTSTGNLSDESPTIIGQKGDPQPSQHLHVTFNTGDFGDNKDVFCNFVPNKSIQSDNLKSEQCENELPCLYYNTSNENHLRPFSTEQQARFAMRHSKDEYPFLETIHPLNTLNKRYFESKANQLQADENTTQHRFNDIRTNNLANCETLLHPSTCRVTNPRLRAYENDPALDDNEDNKHHIAVNDTSYTPRANGGSFENNPLLYFPNCCNNCKNTNYEKAFQNYCKTPSGVAHTQHLEVSKNDNNRSAQHKLIILKSHKTENEDSKNDNKKSRYTVGKDNIDDEKMPGSSNTVRHGCLLKAYDEKNNYGGLSNDVMFCGQNERGKVNVPRFDSQCNQFPDYSNVTKVIDICDSITLNNRKHSYQIEKAATKNSYNKEQCARLDGERFSIESISNSEISNGECVTVKRKIFASDGKFEKDSSRQNYDTGLELKSVLPAIDSSDVSPETIFASSDQFVGKCRCGEMRFSRVQLRTFSPERTIDRQHIILGDSKIAEATVLTVSDSSGVEQAPSKSPHCDNSLLRPFPIQSFREFKNRTIGPSSHSTNKTKNVEKYCYSNDNKKFITPETSYVGITNDSKQDQNIETVTCESIKKSSNHWKSKAFDEKDENAMHVIQSLIKKIDQVMKNSNSSQIEANECFKKVEENQLSEYLIHSSDWKRLAVALSEIEAVKESEDSQSSVNERVSGREWKKLTLALSEVQSSMTQCPASDAKNLPDIPFEQNNKDISYLVISNNKGTNTLLSSRANVKGQSDCAEVTSSSGQNPLTCETTDSESCKTVSSNTNAGLAAHGGKPDEIDETGPNCKKHLNYIILDSESNTSSVFAATLRRSLANEIPSPVQSAIFHPEIGSPVLDLKRTRSSRPLKRRSWLTPHK